MTTSTNISADTPTQVSASPLPTPVIPAANTGICNRKPVPVAPGKSYDYVPPTVTPLLRPFFFNPGIDIDYTPSLTTTIPVQLPFDSTGAVVSDEDIEDSFTSAQDKLHLSEESTSGQPSTDPNTPPSGNGSTPPSSTPPRRSTRQTRAPARIVYDEDFNQHLINSRTTKHQQRKPPTPVKKHPSQESRDKIKLKRGKSLSKK